jgi:hypothetical protein
LARSIWTEYLALPYAALAIEVNVSPSRTVYGRPVLADSVPPSWGDRTAADSPPRLAVGR